MGKKLGIEIKSLGDYEVKPEAVVLIAKEIKSSMKQGIIGGGFHISLSSGDIDIPYEYYVAWSLE